jgi:Flp pilus assembly protein CpaB
MIAVAAVFGLLAVFVSQAWLNRQAEARLKSLEAQKTVTVATRTLVVASRPLRFGTELDGDRDQRADPQYQDYGGQRATLSALIADGKKASTIRVNDVDGACCPATGAT